MTLFAVISISCLSFALLCILHGDGALQPSLSCIPCHLVLAGLGQCKALKEAEGPRKTDSRCLPYTSTCVSNPFSSGRVCSEAAQGACAVLVSSRWPPPPPASVLGAVVQVSGCSDFPLFGISDLLLPVLSLIHCLNYSHKMNSCIYFLYTFSSCIS